MKKYSHIWINGLAALFNFIVAAVNYMNESYIWMAGACVVIGLSLGVALTLDCLKKKVTSLTSQLSQEPL